MKTGTVVTWTGSNPQMIRSHVGIVVAIDDDYPGEERVVVADGALSLADVTGEYEHRSVKVSNLTELSPGTLKALKP